jgi:hypothetical protein
MRRDATPTNLTNLLSVRRVASSDVETVSLFIVFRTLANVFIFRCLVRKICLLLFHRFVVRFVKFVFVRRHVAPKDLCLHRKALDINEVTRDERVFSVGPLDERDERDDRRRRMHPSL